MLNSIYVFPNSGHHYDFVPLPKDLPNAAKLALLCRSDRSPWHEHPTYKWIRYRLATREAAGDAISGIWVAIESNLGPPQRGLVFEPYRQVDERQPDSLQARLATPYASHEESDVRPLEGTTVDVHDPDTGEVIATLPLPNITWTKRSADDEINVDLVVDFGNTRTVALLLENDQDARPLQEVCEPVRFLRRAMPYAPFDAAPGTDDPCAIVDSWIVLHEPVFSDFWPPSAKFTPVVVPSINEVVKNKSFLSKGEKVQVVTGETRFAPQMFVEFSPVILGGGNGTDSARQILNDADLNREANFFLSSPKRYAWDNNPVGYGGKQYWHMQLNRWNPARYWDTGAQIPELSGPVLLMMDTDGRHWAIDVPPNERPNVEQRPHAKDKPIYPRRDTLTWAALGVLETAYRQLMSQEHRNSCGRPNYPRRLRSVLVTFPSGWTTPELQSYRQQWDKAINIFTLAHMQKRGLATESEASRCGDRPLLVTNLDEAVASQLPIIYSEITAMVNGENWIELVGRGAGTNASVRVMNVDIGGGTTDLSIVDYRDKLLGPQVNLETRLLFKNSSSVAGDTLVRRIIERVLLPSIGNVFREDNEQFDLFKQLFSHTPPEWSRMESALRFKMARIVRLVFIPIVNHWLHGLSQQQLDGPQYDVPLSEMYDAHGQHIVPEVAVDEFNTLVRRFVLADPNSQMEVLPWRDDRLPRDVARLRSCIRDVFSDLFQLFGEIASAFDCDLVLVSGKPSELPEMRDVLLEAIPLLPQRIIFSRDFPVGDWYPMGASKGLIRDAKTPTVVGAALYQRMSCGNIPNWKISTDRQFILNRNHWGVMPSGADSNPGMFDQLVFLDATADQGSCDLLVPSSIGRKRFLSPHIVPEQVYKLRWSKDRHFDRCQLHVTFERSEIKGASEELRIKEVEGVDEENRQVSVADVELTLCTLSEADFWMDNPKFILDTDGT